MMDFLTEFSTASDFMSRSLPTEHTDVSYISSLQDFTLILHVLYHSFLYKMDIPSELTPRSL